jgi:hypothetical protein
VPVRNSSASRNERDTAQQALAARRRLLTGQMQIKVIINIPSPKIIMYL